MRYRRKFKSVRAYTWRGTDKLCEAPGWVFDALATGKIIFNGKNAYVKALDGTKEVKKGEWIVEGSRGEIYVHGTKEFFDKYEEDIAVRQSGATNKEDIISAALSMGVGDMIDIITELRTAVVCRASEGSAYVGYKYDPISVTA